MNKIVVIANAKFEKGLIAFINSYQLSFMKTPLVIIDTGLKNSYPYETIKKTFDSEGIPKAEWMSDASPYLQCQLGDIDADKIIYMEADMLILKNIDHLFDEITDDCPIAVMDDAAKITYDRKMHGIVTIDNAGRYFNEGSELREKYKYCKGWNGGLIGGTRKFYKDMQNKFSQYLFKYVNQYRLLAQSFLNQYFIEEHIFVKDIGFEYNFSGINEYYGSPQLYKIGWKKDIEIYTRFMNCDISVLHFTGRGKPFLNDDKNIMTPIFNHYYNEGELINV